MKIRLITDREIDPKDLDIWLRMYRDECQYPIDVEKIKAVKVAIWSGDFPEVRSRCTTTMLIDPPKARKLLGGK
jgi:hypothetical protein